MNSKSREIAIISRIFRGYPTQVERNEICLLTSNTLPMYFPHQTKGQSLMEIEMFLENLQKVVG